MPTDWLGLVNDYEAQADAALPGEGPVYPADEIDRLHNAVDSQLSLTIENTPIGVIWNPDRTSLEVAAGTGLSVTIQPGYSKNLHSTYGPAQIELSGVLTLTGLEPSVTRYIFSAIDVTVDNDTRATGLPKFTVQAGSTLDGGVVLARVVIGASTITSVTDLRVPVRFQDVDIDGQDALASLDAADELLAYDASTGKTVKITKANFDSDYVHKSGAETIPGIKTFSASPIVPTPTTGTQAANKDYVDTAVTGLLDLKGSTDCSTNPNYPAALKGDTYIVSVAGKIGGASGVTVDVGDVYFANVDNAGGTQAAVGTSWTVLEHGAILTSALTVFNAESESEPNTDSIEFKNAIVDATGSGNVTVQNSLTFTNEAALAAYAATLTGGVLPDGIDIVLTAPTGIYQPQPRVITADTTVTVNDSVIFVNATSGNIIVTLLAATVNHKVGVKKTDATANTVTVARAGSDTVDGGTSKVISAQWESYYFEPNGVSLWGVF